MGSPDDLKIHIGLLGSIVGNGGSEALIKIARHLTFGYRKSDRQVVKILKNSVIHFFIISPPESDAQTQPGNSIQIIYLCLNIMLLSDTVTH